MDKANKIEAISSGHGGRPLLCRLIFIVLFSAALLWVVGPVMRESDQASVLNGALLMARNGELAGEAIEGGRRQGARGGGGVGGVCGLGRH